MTLILDTCHCAAVSSCWVEAVHEPEFEALQCSRSSLVLLLHRTTMLAINHCKYYRRLDVTVNSTWTEDLRGRSREYGIYQRCKSVSAPAVWRGSVSRPLTQDIHHPVTMIQRSPGQPGGWGVITVTLPSIGQLGSDMIDGQQWPRIAFPPRTLIQGLLLHKMMKIKCVCLIYFNLKWTPLLSVQNVF